MFEIIFSLLFLGSVSFAGNETLSAKIIDSSIGLGLKFTSQDKIVKAATQALVPNLCRQIEGVFAFKKCFGLYKELVLNLDLQQHDIGGISFFRSELDDLLASDEVNIYLFKLALQLEKTSDINLWKFTLAHTQNIDKTIQLLAVLFQDWDRRNLTRLNPKKSTGIRLKNIKLLYRIYGRIWPGREQSQIGLYPEELYARYSPNRKMYHFYVVAYLTQKLAQTQRSMDALKISFLFNYVGELLTMYNDPINYNRPNILLEKFDHKDNIDDIYAGYLGAHFAVGLWDHAISYSEIDNFLRRPFPLFSIF